MKKLFLLFVSLVLVIGMASCGGGNSSSKGEKQDVEVDTKNETDEKMMATEAQIDKTSFEYFASIFTDSIRENINYNDTNTSMCLERIEKYFPEMSNVEVETFDSQANGIDWYYEIGNAFGYLYYYFDDGTKGKNLGEYGLLTLHSVLLHDLASYESHLEATKEACAAINLNPDTKSIVGKVNAGQYKVGTDITPGEYALFASGGSGYFSVCSDANGRDIIFNDNFSYNSFITIYDGEYLELSRCYAVPLTENDIELNTSGEGMFRVGVDIPAGEYKVAASGDNGYYCVYSDSRHGDIVANDFFTGQSYVTVNDGEYLILSGCKLDL